MELYKKIDASTPPEKEGEYLTSIGWESYSTQSKEWRYRGNLARPAWYLLPVTGEKMSHEQALDQAAQAHGYDNWEEAIGYNTVLKDDHPLYDRPLLKYLYEAAELYLSTNTAHLVEELERVKDGYLKCSAGYLSVRTEANQLAEVLELWVKADDDFETNMGRNGMEIAAQSAVINNAKRKAKERLSAYRTETKGGSNDNV